MIFAACVLVALAASSGSQSAPSSLAMKRFARQQELQTEGNETTLEGEGAGEGEAAAGGMAKVPAMPKIDFSWDKIRFPTTWAALHVSFPESHPPSLTMIFAQTRTAARPGITTASSPNILIVPIKARRFS
jgi:hypothetical protein